jgi:hypothetical protein
VYGGMAIISSSSRALIADSGAPSAGALLHARFLHLNGNHQGLSTSWCRGPTYRTSIGTMEKSTMAITTGTFLPYRELAPDRDKPDGNAMSLLD